MVQKKQSVLNKAGLFSEDLSDAVYSEAPEPVKFIQSISQMINKIINFEFVFKQDSKLLSQHFEVTQKPNHQTIVFNNNNDENDSKPSTSKSSDKENDLKRLLDDGEDDALMDLNFWSADYRII